MYNYQLKLHSQLSIPKNINKQFCFVFLFCFTVFYLFSNDKFMYELPKGNMHSSSIANILEQGNINWGTYKIDHIIIQI